MLEELPKWMARLEKIISGNLGYAVGTTLSLADVVIQQNLRDYFDDRKAVSIILCVFHFPVILSKLLFDIMQYAGTC